MNQTLHFSNCSFFIKKKVIPNERLSWHLQNNQHEFNKAVDLTWNYPYLDSLCTIGCNNQNGRRDRENCDSSCDARRGCRQIWVDPRRGRGYRGQRYQRGKQDSCRRAVDIGTSLPASIIMHIH